MGVVLARHREIAAVARAGIRSNALGDFELNDDVDGGDVVSPLEEVMEDRLGDVVGQIAVDAKFFVFGKASAPCDVEKIEREDVAFGDFDVWPLRGMNGDLGAEIFGKQSIRFDSDEAARAFCRKMTG